MEWTLGNYEKGFVAGTVALARMLSECDAKVIIGGGDTLVCVKRNSKPNFNPRLHIYRWRRYA